jgi:hypothetical protein
MLEQTYWKIKTIGEREEMSHILKFQILNWTTLLEKGFFFSFGFRSSTEKVSTMLLFQAQTMIYSWKKNIFIKYRTFFIPKKNIFSTVTVLNLNFLFFLCFCFKSVWFNRNSSPIPKESWPFFYWFHRNSKMQI